MLPWLARQARVAAADRLARARQRRQWCIGISLGRGEGEAVVHLGAPPTYSVIHTPVGRSWADPFPVEHDGHCYVFLEDLCHETRRGHISVARVASTSLADPSPVIQSDLHLSYPFPIRWQGHWYLMPQMNGILGAYLYRATTFPTDWELHDHVLPTTHLVDATVERIDGRWWLFATSSPRGAPPWDSLSVFHGPSPLGPWEPHSRNPVKIDARSSRPAGALFFKEGHWYRPAQDCSVRYGFGVVFNRIDLLSEDAFVETPISRWTANREHGLIAHHTFNSAGPLSVVDFQTGPAWDRHTSPPTTTPLLTHPPAKYL